MSSSYPNSNLPTMPQTPEPNNSAPENIKRQTERRKAHTAAEKRRRDAINKGYEDLQKSLPLSSNQNNSGNNENQPNNTTNSNDEGSNNSNNEPGLPPAKVSKSSILHVAVEYLDFLTKQEESNRSKIEEVDGNIKILKMVVQSFSDINKFSSELRVHKRDMLHHVVLGEAFANKHYVDVTLPSHPSPPPNPKPKILNSSNQKSSTKFPKIYTKTFPSTLIAPAFNH